MLVGEVMTRNVATVTPETTIAEVAKLFSEKKISGVPVVDKKGIVVGVVSEADLLHRTEIQTQRRHSWWSGLFESDAEMAKEFVRQGSRKVSDIMNPDVISVGENATLAAAAESLDKHKVKRLIVLRGEKLAGIISRADIVRALAMMAAEKIDAVTPGSDDGIRQQLTSRMANESWAKVQFVTTHVHDGVVDLTGFVSSDAQKQALRVLAENTPGVQVVRDRVQVYTLPMDAA